VTPPRPLYARLYVQVLAGIALGIAIGVIAPHHAVLLKPLGDGFIKLIRMLIAPIVFVTVAAGIAKMGAARDVGRIAFKALFYFEAVTTTALLIGLVVANLYRPGAGIHVDVATLDPKAVADYTSKPEFTNTVDFLLHVIPESAFDAFAKGEILQVLLLAILTGLVLLHLGDRTKPLLDLLDRGGELLFGMIGLIMRLAPIGAFGAMAFTIGKFGPGTLLKLGALMAGVYTTCLLFVFVVLGTISRLTGFSLWRFLVYIREEILIVLGTSSSESVLPRLMTKLEAMGCAKPVVGLVVPTGYSFNLDGTSIYMTMATVFLAQALDLKLTLLQTLTILGVLLLTSKGAAAVTGGGFITLAATLAATRVIPVEGLALLLGVDRFMSEARAITNLIGNGVATIVISAWDGALDRERMNAVLESAGAVTPAT
jgi:aerobic C4-dicarboxylate transport protein